MQQNHLNTFAILLIMLVVIVIGPTSGRAADSIVSTTQPSAAQAIVDQRGNIRITYDGAATSENSFVLKQSGEANLAKQVGYGRGGSMTVVQAMRDNTAIQQQFGRNDTAIIVQSGMGNVARQTQR